MKTTKSVRKIADLLKYEGRIYIFLRNKEIGGRFMKEAESEGFTFGDGALPTKREWSDLIAINRDKTICYVGYIGHIAFANSSEITKIDYEKYLSGEENYFYKKC